MAVIFFDATGTLFRLSKSVGAHYADVALEQGFELPADALDQAFRRAWKLAPLRPAIDGAREDDDKPWWRDFVATMLEQLSPLPPGFDRAVFFESAYSHFALPGVWVLFPEVIETLGALPHRFELNVISNFDRRLHAILRELGIHQYFRHIFVSSQLGVDKPSPEIYRRALRLSGFTAGQALHAGDDPERDWHAAATAGLQVFRLNRPHNSLRDLVGQLRL